MTTARVTSAAHTARPYVQRAITDDEVRDSVKSAIKAAREIYDELIGDRSVSRVASRVATDEDIHDNLRTAVTELRRAADRLQGHEEHHRINRFVLAIGIAMIALLNPITGPATRSWLKSKLGGGSGSDYAYTGGNGSV